MKFENTSSAEFSKEITMSAVIAAPVSFSYDFDSFSDLYKEANGIRPGAYYYEWLEKATDEERQKEWDFLCSSADARYRQRQEDQAASLELLEIQLAKTCADNKVDEATAIRWMMDAYGTRGDYQYLDYSLGVPYGTIEKKLGLKPLNVG
jgi:hypothetical protein